jgi:hypothetical protein
MLDVLRLLGALPWPRRKSPADRDAEILSHHQRPTILLLGHTITKPMHGAATRVLDDCSLASGGGLVAGATLGISTSRGPSMGLPERQVDAITRLRAAWAIIEGADREVFFWIVFQDGSPREYERLCKMRHGSAVDAFKATLSDLEAHYAGDHGQDNVERS